MEVDRMAVASRGKKSQKDQVEDPFYNAGEAAAYLGQTERWVRRRVGEGTIRYAKMGLHLRFRKSWLDEYIEQHTVTPEGE
jgi:excisionase family DNA binding protein